MASNDLDYFVWQEHDGQRSRYNWEVVTVDDDGNETAVESGVADSEREAMAKVREAMSSHA